MNSMQGGFEISREMIVCLLDNNGLTSWFQPIFSRRSGEIYGYEALARLQGRTPDNFHIARLFAQAQALGIISSLDMLCRENALCRAADLGLAGKNSFLYLNICPATLMHPDHKCGMTDTLAENCGIAKEKIILEITEQEAIRNYNLFKRSVDHYRARGYKIAIDDFGAGYGGLKMLSIIEPDFVKVDRHFITNVDRDPVKYNLIDALSTVCHKLGITVIAEGIERPEELAVISGFGIDLLQGYLLARPAPELSDHRIEPPVEKWGEQTCQASIFTSCTIGNIAKPLEPLSPAESLMTAYRRFTESSSLQGLPIVEDKRVVGMLSRMRFLEKQLIGPYGYGFALSTHRAIAEVLEPDFLVVESATPVEEVVRVLQERRGVHLYDDICVTRNGKYVGTVAINVLLKAITERSIQLAKGANPLSGLPGNEFIQRTVSQLIGQNVHFDVCYIDIDDFKPYNDFYGFEKGDTVIKSLADLLVATVQAGGNDRFRFVGHIGGDDFIVITRPHASVQLCQEIVEGFTRLRAEFHGSLELTQGFYLAMDRQGEERRFSPLSLSIGIVSTEQCKVNSYGELAFLASGVKKAAKKQKGFSIVRNKRCSAQAAVMPLENKAA
ncbi:EAL domain-containing protein [Thiovibrio sp. JS02]